MLRPKNQLLRTRSHVWTIKLESHVVKSKDVRSCMHSLCHILWHNTRLYWVPGYCSIEGNKQVDALAWKGSEMYEEETIEEINAPLHEFFYKLELLELDRRTIHVPTRFLTAHCFIGSLADNLGLSHHYYCRNCQGMWIKRTKVIQHLLCVCPAIQNIYYRFMGDWTFADTGMMANMI